MGREELLLTAGHAQFFLHSTSKRDLNKCKCCTAPGLSLQLPEGCDSQLQGWAGLYPLQSITHQNDQHLEGNQHPSRAQDHAAVGHTSAGEGCAELRSIPPWHRARPRAQGCSESNRQQGKTLRICSSLQRGTILEAGQERPQDLPLAPPS